MIQPQNKRLDPRGANQSVDTKYATTLISEALKELQSGRANKCAAILEHALVLLPDLDNRTQKEAAAKRTARGIGFSNWVERNT